MNVFGGWRLVRILWQRIIVLSWPVIVEQSLRTLMRTTDLILMGLFNPAAVTAVGLGDVYGRVVLRLGMGLGTGTLALSAQETGAAREANTHEVLTQSTLIAFALGLPFALAGWVFSESLIALFGAGSQVVLYGARYLQIILLTSPMRLVGLVIVRALQGSGDTRTPMIVRLGSNGVNIMLSVLLATGWGWAPRLGVSGVAIGTAASDVLTASVLLSYLFLDRSPIHLRLPEGGWNLVLARQIVTISIPQLMTGGVVTLAEFPLNAMILLFGTEAGAAYHISRRIQQQFLGPFQRAFAAGSSILVGQSLGRGLYHRSRWFGTAAAVLSALVTGLLTAGLIVFAPEVSRLFIRDASTLAATVPFVRAYAVAGLALSIYSAFSGALKGAGDTRTPFLATLGGVVLFKLGFSYGAAVLVGVGLAGIYSGIVLDYAFRLWFAHHIYQQEQWIKDGRRLIRERRAMESGGDD